MGTIDLRHLTPPTLDFTYILNVGLVLLCLYLASSIFMFLQAFIMAGVAQGIVYDMRNNIEKKLARMPLRYFDLHTHGEILSRVTNDVDNIGTTLSQSMTQVIMAVVTLVGILIMMLTISGWLTIIALVTLPLAGLVTASSMKQSQKFFGQQWKMVGEVNGHVEEMFTGHVVVKAFGREQQSIEQFEQLNQKLYQRIVESAVRLRRRLPADAAH